MCVSVSGSMYTSVNACLCFLWVYVRELINSNVGVRLTSEDPRSSPNLLSKFYRSFVKYICWSLTTGYGDPRHRVVKCCRRIAKPYVFQVRSMKKIG